MNDKPGSLAVRSFEKLLPSITGDRESAYNFLRRLQIVLIDHETLKRQVEQQIRFTLYRPDSREVSTTEVIGILGDYVEQHLGSTMPSAAAWAALNASGYHHRDWARDHSIQKAVSDENAGFRRAIDVELINGAAIPRAESNAIISSLFTGPQKNRLLLFAPAGLGKSCVLSQAMSIVADRGIPHLIIRLDRHGDARLTKDVGAHMGLPQSPVLVLAGLANGGDCVLLIDQLDAASQVSGRYPHLWQIFDSLRIEAVAYPNMRLVVACREFDLKNDPRLRPLINANFADRIEVRPLSPAEVSRALKAKGFEFGALTERQLELLGTPLHLLLFLEGLAGTDSSVNFQNTGELYDRYWDRKQKAVSERLGHPSDWTAVVDSMCETMSRDLGLYVADLTLDNWRDTVQAMLTEHVLIQDGHQIRFFHESFFDYAFARRFIA